MSNEKNQLNSCCIEGKIVGRIKFVGSCLPSGDMATFNLRNLFSYYDEFIDQRRKGVVDFQIKMFGVHVRGQVENLKSGDVICVKGKIISMNCIYGYMITSEKK